VNSVTGKPIWRALVAISPRHEAVLTGPGGTFSFEGIPGGQITVMVTKPGFFRPGDVPVVLDLNADKDNLLIKLLPEAVITGQATDNDQEPIEFAIMDVLKEQIVQGHRHLTYFTRNSTTDQEGNFRIDGLPPGVYYVGIRGIRMDRRIPVKEAHEAFPLRVYYPDASDIASATPIKVNAGQHRELSFPLKPVPTFKVAGRVVVAEGWTLEYGPRLFEATMGVLALADRVDTQTGAFEFSKLPAGTYVVQVTGKNQQGESSNYQRKLTVDSDVSDLQLALWSGINIPVVIQMDFPKLLGNCSHTERAPNGEYHVRESDCSEYPAVLIQLSPVDTKLQRSTGPGPSTGKADLSVRGVYPGKYWVGATPFMSGGYVESVRSGSVDLFLDPLVVPESGQVPPIEVTLRNDVGEMQVHVRGALPKQPIELLVFSDPITNAEPHKNQTDLGPDFRITQLAPGLYKVFAFDPNDGLEYSNPEVLTRYSSQAGSVRVRADGHASITVDLIHTEEQ